MKLRLIDLLRSNINEQVKEGEEQPYMSLNPNAGKFITPRIKATAKNSKNQELEQELQSAFGDVYTTLITSFTTADTNISSTIWYLKLNQDIRKQMLTQLQKYLNENKKPKVVIRISQGKIDIETTPGSSPVVINLPVDLAGANVFIDNKSDVSGAVKQIIDSRISEIRKSIETSIQQYPDMKFKLSSLLVAASASRFRNTNEAANLTWAQLSEARGNNVAKYVLQQLSSLGIDISNFEFSAGGGYNGDGTSGPNPGKDQNGNQYTISLDGRFNAIDSKLETLNKFGTPLANKEDYDQFKFILINADIIASAGDTKPAIVSKFKNYEMEIAPVGKVNLVKISHDIQKRNPFPVEVRNKVINKALECSFQGKGLKKRLVQRER